MDMAQLAEQILNQCNANYKRSMNPWNDCIVEAFQDAGIIASRGQIDTVIVWIEGEIENGDMARGYDAIPNPLLVENTRLKHQLEKNDVDSGQISSLKDQVKNKDLHIQGLESTIRELRSRIE